MNGTDDFWERKIRSELEALEHWDKNYWATGQHDDLERQAYRRRQFRRREILAELKNGRPNARSTQGSPQ